jgi:hypothetical protein
MTIPNASKIQKRSKLVDTLSMSLITATVFTQASAIAADYDYGYEADELRLVGTDLYGEPARNRPFFDDRYVPDFGESRLITEARAAPYLRYNVTANFRNIPTAVDGMQCVERNGFSTVRPGAYLQPFPQHDFFWAAVSARGWLLAKLKHVGELDAFVAPSMLGPVCHFSTSMRWQRYADSFANGHPKVD